MEFTRHVKIAGEDVVEEEPLRSRSLLRGWPARLLDDTRDLYWRIVGRSGAEEAVSVATESVILK